MAAAVDFAVAWYQSQRMVVVAAVHLLEARVGAHSPCCCAVAQSSGRPDNDRPMMCACCWLTANVACVGVASELGAVAAQVESVAKQHKGGFEYLVTRDGNEIKNTSFKKKITSFLKTQISINLIIAGFL